MLTAKAFSYSLLVGCALWAVVIFTVASLVK
ncbi:hypothetical protein [Citrobacter phage Tr1]|nr:hypothetical protein [Citrobacter phage Tr1]